LEEDEINYRTLRKTQQMEKNTPTLTDVMPNFYSNVTNYLTSLDKRMENESSEQKQTLLKDEIKNIRKIAINIYEQREKKILLSAVSKARGGNPDLKNMINEEKEIFDDILGIMKKSRQKILENKKQKEILEEKTPETEQKIEEKEEEKENIENPNPIVKVNQDIPEFIGTDKKKYNLRTNDVLSIPVEMSEILIKKGAVEKINQ